MGGTASLKPLSPVPLFETRVGGLDFLYNTTFVTKALFTSETFHNHLGELVSMPPLAGGQGICSDSTWLSSGRKTRVPVSTPRPGSPPAPTTE